MRTVLTAMIALAPPAARAELQVRSPLVEYREFEFEHNGYYGLDRKGSAFDGVQSYTYSVGYGVLPFWKIELEAEAGVLPGANQSFDAATIENTFQLVPNGKYLANIGLFAEYSQSQLDTLPSSITIGPIIQTELSDFAGVDSLHTLNVFLSRDIGHSHTNDTGLFYAAQSKVLLIPLFSPGIEAFGNIGNLTSAGRYSDQEHSIGPVITGEFLAAPYGKFKYEIGYQRGLTAQTARSGIRWKFEYEMVF